MDVVFGTTRREDGDYRLENATPEAIAGVIDARHGVAPKSSAWLEQIHSDRILKAGPGLVGEGDGLITSEPGIALTIRTADCVPVFLEAPDGIALLHAGMAGVLKEILPKAIGMLGEPENIRATFGPHICEQCYLMSANNLKLLDEYPKYRSMLREGDGGQFLPMQRILVEQAKAAGATQITETAECTKHGGAHYSSRNGEDGRVLSYMLIRHA